MDEEVEITLLQDEVTVDTPLVGDYILPTATSSTLGGVKIGNNINIDSNGHIFVPYAGTTNAGVVKVGNGLAIDANGVLSSTGDYVLPQATKNTLGGVYVDDQLDTESVNPVQNAVVSLELDSISGNLSTLSGTVSGMSGTVTGLVSNVGGLSSTVNTLGNKVTTLGNTVNNVSSTVSTLSNTVGTLNNDVTNLQTGLGETSQNVSDLMTSLCKDKTLAIYGDSISTFAGYNPSGNAVYYTGYNAGVENVSQTWWMKVIEALKYDLLVNNSWSGRAVSNVRDSDPAHSTDAGYKQDNIDVLGTEGDPDVIIIKLGINDFNNNAPLGTYDGTTAIPNDPTNFTDAYAIMLDRIMTTYPQAEVYCCTLMDCERTGTTGFPEINGNGDSLIEWNKAIATLAEAFGAKLLNHAVCGITHYNLDVYTGDYDSGTGKGLHPNADGMSLIANITINEIDNSVRTRY